MVLPELGNEEDDELFEGGILEALPQSSISKWCDNVKGSLNHVTEALNLWSSARLTEMSETILSLCQHIAPQVQAADLGLEAHACANIGFQFLKLCQARDLDDANAFLALDVEGSTMVATLEANASDMEALQASFASSLRVLKNFTGHVLPLAFPEPGALAKFAGELPAVLEKVQRAAGIRVEMLYGMNSAVKLLEYKAEQAPSEGDSGFEFVQRLATSRQTLQSKSHEELEGRKKLYALGDCQDLNVPQIGEEVIQQICHGDLIMRVYHRYVASGLLRDEGKLQDALVIPHLKTCEAADVQGDGAQPLHIKQLAGKLVGTVGQQILDASGDEAVKAFERLDDLHGKAGEYSLVTLATLQEGADPKPFEWALARPLCKALVGVHKVALSLHIAQATLQMPVVLKTTKTYLI